MTTTRNRSAATGFDQLLTDLHDWTPNEFTGFSVVRELRGLAGVLEPPTVAAPAWLGRAIIQMLEHVARHWPQEALFVQVRRLERVGLVTIEHDQTYVLAMVSGLGDRHEPSRVAAIRDDAEIRETLVWRVFEVEGDGEVSLANVDKYSAPAAGWADTFRVLVAEGTLSRASVLTHCLRALGGDFSSYRAGWFSQLFTSLEPITEEVAEREELILGLLRSSVPATVSFAMRYLTVLDKAGLLDAEAFLPRFTLVAAASTKTAPLAAIDVAARIAARRPDLVATAVEALGYGLEHPHRDVQTRAVKALRALDARDTVAERVDLLEPTVKVVVADWLGIRPVQPPTPVAQPPVPLRSLPPVAAEATLAERAAALMAGASAAAEIELFLAALATTKSHVEELAAVRGQALKVRVRTQHELPLGRSIAMLVLAATGDRDIILDGNAGFLQGRLTEVLEIVSGRREPGILLASPTDPAGWLDPRTLVQRLATLTEPPPHHDLVGALLRLSTEGRAEALARARNLPDEAGAAVRYALGGPTGEVRTPPWWIAAARARSPFDDDQFLIDAGLPGAGAGHAATFDLRLDPKVHTYQDNGRTRNDTWWRPTLVVHPAPAVESADRPTVVSSSKTPYRDGWLPWVASIWPHDGEAFFAQIYESVHQASSRHAEVDYRTRPALEALLTHPGRLGFLAATVLAAGLSTRDVQERTISAEAFAALVPNRISFALQADAMHNQAGHCTASRWSGALRDAATMGAGASVAILLSHLLPALPYDHPGLHGLVATLHEEWLRAGKPSVGDGLRPWLAGQRGGSKLATSARAMLADLDGRAA